MRSECLAKLVVTMLGLSWAATISAPAVGSDATKAVPPVTAMSVPELRQLCRSGRAETLLQPDTDGNAILQHQAQSRAACDRLVEGSGLQDDLLTEALLDRADLESPSQGESYTRALDDYARALAVSPRSANAYWRRGKAYLLYERDLDAARKDLDVAIRLDPSQAELYVTRASILAWLEEPDAALVELNQALAHNPHSVHALTNRGIAYFNTGDTSRALADFDAALALSPDNASIYSFRAAARRKAGDETGAKTDEAKMAKLMFGTPQ